VGIFFASPQPALPAIRSAIKECLLIDPKTLADPDREAAHRTLLVSRAVSPTFNTWRFVGAVVIAAALLAGAVWTGLHNLPDISKALMTSFSGFSGIVLGLLGGEAQKSPSG
jgi:hypothetical protein